MDLEGAEEMDRGLSTSAHSANATSMSKERTIYYRELVIIFAGIGEDLRPWRRICKPSMPLNLASDFMSRCCSLPSEPPVRPLAYLSSNSIRTTLSSASKKCIAPLSDV